MQRLAGAVSTTIAGHRALQAEHHQSPGPWLRTLAWEYAPNAWAVLDSSADRADLPTMRQLQATAAKLTGAPARSVTVPFTLGYVPAGYDVFAVGDHMTGSLDAVGGPRPCFRKGVELRRGPGVVWVCDGIVLIPVLYLDDFGVRPDGGWASAQPDHPF